MAREPRRVFLSHTSEFSEYPREKKTFIQAAVEAVLYAGDVPCDMEHFPARDQKPAEYCKDQVKACQVYVGIIGLRYGSAVRDRREVSYTELEFEAATEAEMERLVFLLDPDALGVPFGRLTDPEHFERQLHFRERLTDSGLTVKKFGTPDELAMHIVQALRPGDGASTQRPYRLRVPKRKGLPKNPYPLLSPYEHPDLFAGRDGELQELTEILGGSVPILGFFSTSGAGKSSLLQAGLVHRLQMARHPVSYEGYPAERNLATRLIGQMLEWEGENEFPDDDLRPFQEALRETHRLSNGKPGILIVDQFEDILAPSAADETQEKHLFEARKRIGGLLAASVTADPRMGVPLCRWVLSYRHEFHGRVVEWLQDTFHEAGIAWRGRFQEYPLKPLGGSGSIETSAAAFLEAIQSPLQVLHEGRLRYPISFERGGAERLAEAFAQTRSERPEAPLVPELQVVLEHLLRQAGWPSGHSVKVRVPEKIQEEIGSALANHLERAIKKCLPETEAKYRGRRAEVCLVLRRLASDESKRNQGRSVEELKQSLSDKDQGILETLSTEHRILYPVKREGKTLYLLSHDRLAEVVVRLASNPELQKWLDPELLSLQPIVTNMVTLYSEDEKQGVNLTKSAYRRVESHARALLTNDQRRKWWDACVRHRNELRRRSLAGLGSAAAAFFLIAALAIGWWLWASSDGYQIGQIRSQAPGLVQSSSEESSALWLQSSAVCGDLQSVEDESRADESSQPKDSSKALTLSAIALALSHLQPKEDFQGLLDETLALDRGQDLTVLRPWLRAMVRGGRIDLASQEVSRLTGATRSIALGIIVVELVAAGAKEKASSLALEALKEMDLADPESVQTVGKVLVLTGLQDEAFRKAGELEDLKDAFLASVAVQAASQGDLAVAQEALMNIERPNEASSAMMDSGIALIRAGESDQGSRIAREGKELAEGLEWPEDFLSAVLEKETAVLAWIGQREESYKTADGIKVPFNKGKALISIGNASLVRGERAEALDAYRKAREESMVTKAADLMPENKSRILVGVALGLAQLKEYAEARSVANDLSPSGKLIVYSSMLLEYQKERDPKLDGLFVDQHCLIDRESPGIPWPLPGSAASECLFGAL